VHDAVPGIQEADDLIAVDHFAFSDDSADDSIEAGAISATGEDSDTHVGAL
jgi:hypothetical protein